MQCRPDPTGQFLSACSAGVFRSHFLINLLIFVFDLQNEHRRSERSPHTPGSDARPVFGLMDSNPATLAEQRRRAQKISEELMNTADGRRTDGLEKRWNEQKREREIMQRDHKE